ncbi:MAG: hypothetical protein WEA28_13815 [Xanthobacteraceae bacterium]
MLGIAPASLAQDATGVAEAPVVRVAAKSHWAKVARYIRARQAYEEKADAYWQSIAEMRRARFAKRRNGEPVRLDDYVLDQPPVYSGPPRPPGYRPPRPDPTEPRLPIPVVADFLKAAAEQFHFVPQRPKDEDEFKQAYAKVAAAAGLTKDQAVRIYAFETGGNGTYDLQAGLTSRSKNARPISPALGYNQLLSTNTVGLLAEHGDDFIKTLQASAAQSNGLHRMAMERKLVALRRMIAFSRTVPNRWSDHDKLAKTTRGGMGVHAAVLDRDIGPLLQTQKLLNSVLFAHMKGYKTPLTAVELELMNFTGDGNGFDMVLMPQQLRERVPTANFFQRGGYGRNPIAHRTGTVAALFAAIESKMDRASQAQGARALAEAF